MRLPDFLVIGAAKSGTTSLNAYLAEQPDVFMCPRRGTRFLALDGPPPRYRAPAGGSLLANGAGTVADLDAYADLFASARADQRVGESCNHYLFQDGAAAVIERCVPDVKLIAILRDPVDRAYSNFLHLKRDGLEPARTFEEALALEPARTRENWGMMWRYTALGMYGSQLERFVQRFPREQIQVLLYEHFKAGPEKVARQVSEFLGLQAGGAIPMPAYNPSGLPRFRVVNALLNRDNALRRIVARPLSLKSKLTLRAYINRHNLRPSRLDPGLSARLRKTFEADRQTLQRLLDLDLSAWPDES